MRESKLTTKWGRYGRSKVKIFTTLIEQPDIYPKEIVLLTGIPFNAVTVTLSRWIRNGWYVERSEDTGGGGTGVGRYFYRTLPEARTWLDIAKRSLPNYQRFINELLLWRDDLENDEIPTYLSLPQRDFIEYTNERINQFHAAIQNKYPATS